MNIDEINNVNALRAAYKACADRNNRLIEQRDELMALLDEVANHIDHGSLPADKLYDLYYRIEEALS